MNRFYILFSHRKSRVGFLMFHSYHYLHINYVENALAYNNHDDNHVVTIHSLDNGFMLNV